RHRRVTGAQRPGRREAHQRRVLQAGAGRGARRSSAGQGRVAVPRRPAPPRGDIVSVRVLVVDDQLPFRVAAASVVGLLDGFEVVGEAASAEDALRDLDTLAPDLVLMDINLPGIDGVEATRRITAHRPATVVVLVSTYRETERRAEVLLVDVGHR